MYARPFTLLILLVALLSTALAREARIYQTSIGTFRLVPESGQDVVHFPSGESQTFKVLPDEVIHTPYSSFVSPNLAEGPVVGIVEIDGTVYMATKHAVHQFNTRRQRFEWIRLSWSWYTIREGRIIINGEEWRPPPWRSSK